MPLSKNSPYMYGMIECRTVSASGAPACQLYPFSCFQYVEDSSSSFVGVGSNSLPRGINRGTALVCYYYSDVFCVCYSYFTPQFLCYFSCSPLLSGRMLGFGGGGVLWKCPTYVDSRAWKESVDTTITVIGLDKGIMNNYHTSPIGRFSTALDRYLP